MKPIRALAILTALLLTIPALTQGDRPTMQPTEFVQRNGIGNFLAKITPGAELTIGYFGASVTNGAGASSEKTKWRWLVHDWLQAQYPGTKFIHQHVVNGGTGAHLGSCRLGREILDHNPALVFVEFSVNDGGQPFEECVKTMEGIIRQIIRRDPTCDIIILHTLNTGALKEYEQGILPSTPTAFEVAAEHYGVPTINVAWVAAQRLIAGEITWEQFSIDSVHPTDLGYKIYGDRIIACFEAWRQGAAPHPRALPEPLRPDNWEDGTMIHVSQATLSPGWRAESPDFARRFPHFPDMRVADTPGESLKFRFKGTHVGLYHVIGPDAGTVEVFVDGQSKGKRALWDRWCSYHRSAFHMLASDLPPGEHEVEIRILDERHEESKGNALHLGYITLKGTLMD